MDRKAFETELTRDGYEIVSITMQPDAVNPPHVHPFDARVMVVDGAMTVDREDTGARTFQVGEWFELQSGCRHSEAAGTAGAIYVAGRRLPANRRGDA
jgi:quercetin dioxygenase-like cupin family protein